MDLIALLSDLGHAIYDIYLVPGDVIIGALRDVFPALVESPVFANVQGSTVLVSTLAWLVATVVLLRMYDRLQTVGRFVASFFDTAWFRLSLALHNIKRTISAPLLKLWAWRQSAGVETSTIEFSKLDIAVLRSALSQPPGITVSAPELAEQFTLRPSQLQCCLDRLSQYRMIESVIGSTDGFENYRATPAGAQFCQQM